MPSTESRIAALEEKVRRLATERDAALSQVRLLQKVQMEKTAELSRERQILSEAERLSHTGAWEWDLGTDQWSFSDEWLTIHGCTQRILGPEDLLSIAHPDDRAAIARAFQDVRDGIAPYHLEHRIVRPDGSVRHIHAHRQYVRDSSGKVIKVYGFAQDITDQKRTEEELRRAQALIEGIAAGTEDMIAAEDSEFRYLFFNEAYRREFQTIWGRDIEVGTSMIEALAPWPEDQRKARELWSRALAGESFSIRMEFGSERERRFYDLHFNPVHDDQGRQIGAAHILREVTEQVRMQRALAESEERYRTLFTNMTEGFALGEPILDEEGQPKDFRFLEINDAFEKQSGLSTEIVGQPATVALPNLESYWIEIFCNVAMGGESVRFEQFNQDTDRWFDVYCYRPAEGRFAILFRDVTKSRRVQESLRKSENLLKEVLKTLPIGVFILSADGRIIHTNPAVWELWGGAKHVDKEQFHEYKGWWADSGERIKAEEWPAARAVTRGETSLDEVIDIECFDGSRKTILNSALPIRDQDGDLSGAIAVSQDITERKSAEKALRESQERYHLVNQATNDIIWDWELKTGHVTWNEAREMTVGRSRAEMPETVESWYQHIHPDDRDRVVAGIHKAISEGEHAWDDEYRFGPAEGPYRTYIDRGLIARDKSGKAYRMIGSVLDLSERKQTEEALRRSEEKFRAVFEQAAVGIGRVSFDDARWIDVNEAVCRMLGYSSEEMLATPWPEITHPEDVDLDLVPFRRMAAGELDTYSVEKRYIHKQGHYVWARLTLSLVRNSQGRPDYEVAVIENITERKQFEDSLKKAKAVAEEASQAKSEFLANMSHEIRTPMTVFMAAVEHLLQTDRNPERRHLLGMADQSAKRLRALIDDVLDFSRIEARKVEIYKAHFDLRGCIREAVEMFALPAREKGLQLEMEIEEEVPRIVVGDPDRLGQVLINLIGNAVKFTHEGEVRVCVRPRDDVLEFSVTDTGIGIPTDKLDLLFQSFSQVDASFTRQYGGTGLGLAISKGLVELMGGEISIQSRKREGSVFTFSLPLKPVEQSRPTPAETQPEAPAEPQTAARILLVEDEPMIREIIIIMLSRKGWLIEIAETGREALDKWAGGTFDLILMDLQMPQMNGLEVTRSIREKESGGEKRICIIGLTAHARRETRDACLQAGMDRVLTKPVQRKDLFSAIEGCLPG